MKKDAIIGAIINYDVQQLKPWVESLERSGFTGDKYMLCYKISYDTADYLRSRGFTLFTFIDVPHLKMYAFQPENRFHICVHRFYHMWYFLNRLPGEVKSQYRYLISTDVGDVIFQSNPSDWLQTNLSTDVEGTKYLLNAATESLKYKDEVLWGAKNMADSFGPVVSGYMKDRLIYNAGTLSGDFQTVFDMFLVIYEMCQGFGTANPDQAAYNLLLSLEPYKNITKFNMSEDGWACQLGTTYKPEALVHFKKNLVEPSPIIDDNGVVYTSTGKPFVIVHQYNRMPELTHKIIMRYS